MVGWRRGIGMLIVALLCGVTVAACGSSKESSKESAKESTNTSAAASSESKELISSAAATAYKTVTGMAPLTKEASLEELSTRLATLEKPPTKLFQTAAVEKKATPRTVVNLVCGVPTCEGAAKGYDEAASLLGWKVTKLSLGLTPEEFGKAFKQAVQDKPELVVASGLNREVIGKSLEELKKAGIPNIEWASGIEAESGEELYGGMIGFPQYEAYGAEMSELLAVKGKMKANVVVYNIPQYAVTTHSVEAMERYLPAICKECTIKVETMSTGEIGKLGARATGYLEANPETKYVVCTDGDFCSGVPEALQSAGDTSAEAGAIVAEATDIQGIHNGTEFGAIPLPLQQVGYQLVDLSQRIFNGETSAVEADNFVPSQVLTKVEDPNSTTIGAYPEFVSAYKKLWLVE